MITMTIILINDMKLSSGIYTASKQRKARTKTTLIKFLKSRNIRSLCNTTHSYERYVPTTGYRRHNCTRTKYINSLGHHKLFKIIHEKKLGVMRLQTACDENVKNFAPEGCTHEWFQLFIFCGKKTSRILSVLTELLTKLSIGSMAQPRGFSFPLVLSPIKFNRINC